MRLTRRQIIAALVFIALLMATVIMIVWPRHDRLMVRLRNLGSEGRYDQVIALAERYSTRESSSGEFFVVLGNAYQQSKRYQDAVTAYRRALSLQPGNLAVPPLLAESLRSLSRQADADAIRWLAEAASCDPTNESIFIDLGRYASLEELLLTPADTAGKIVKVWDAVSRAHPGLLRNKSVRRVVAQMAVVAGNDALADALLPVQGDELAARRLFQAQRAQAGGQLELAVKCVREAYAASPRRQDVLGLMAQLGVAAPAATETLSTTGIPDGSFTVSADSRYLFYDGLRVYDLTEGRFRTPVAGVTGFSVSPSGKYLAYFTNSRDESELYVARLDGSNATLVARGNTYRDQVAWSPDERRLAFTTANGLEVVNADGSGRRVIARASGANGEADSMAPASPAWSPAGDRIAYVVSLWEGTGGTAAVTPSGRAAGFVNTDELDRLRWSASGDWLLADPASWALPGGPPVVVAVDGTASQIAGMSMLIKDAAWSREGAWLAYTADDPAPPETVAGGNSAATPPRRLWIKRWPDGASQLVDVGAGRYEHPQWLSERRLAFVLRSPQDGLKLCIVKLK